MTNEAVVVELGPLGGNPLRYTVQDSVGISGGTVVRLIDPRTVSGNVFSANTGQIIAGIAAADKAAGDGATTLAVYTTGIFDMTAHGAIGLGELVTTSGNRVVRSSVSTDFASGAVLGRALETFSDAEVGLIKLMV